MSPWKKKKPVKPQQESIKCSSCRKSGYYDDSGNLGTTPEDFKQVVGPAMYYHCNYYLMAPPLPQAGMYYLEQGSRRGDHQERRKGIQGNEEGMGLNISDGMRI